MSKVFTNQQYELNQCSVVSSFNIHDVHIFPLIIMSPLQVGTTLSQAEQVSSSLSSLQQCAHDCESLPGNTSVTRPNNQRHLGRLLSTTRTKSFTAKFRLTCGLQKEVVNATLAEDTCTILCHENVIHS